MLIFPAIDLVGGQAVRLLRGDYDQMTVYAPDPMAVARDFAAQGARCMHLVDLEGARDGGTPNLDTVSRLARESGLFTEVGGGIRSMEVLRRYLEAGVDRVILGTAAVTDEDFLRAALSEYGDRVAVGVDLKDGCVAIRGWTETTALTAPWASPGRRNGWDGGSPSALCATARFTGKRPLPWSAAGIVPCRMPAIFPASAGK